MIILYIPFEKHNAGDLTDNALFWEKNHKKNSMEEIKIIYFDEDFDDDEIEKNTTIFVLAHGDRFQPILGNSSQGNITIISLETLVERFNRDFLIVANQLGTIHLYCCGDKGKNAFLAKEFQQALMRPEYSDINYYNGSICAPNGENKRMALINNQMVPAVADSLSALRDEAEFEEFYRKPVKVSTIQQNCKRAKESHRQDYISFRKEQRDEFFLFKRNIKKPMFDNDNPDLVGIDFN